MSTNPCPLCKENCSKSVTPDRLERTYYYCETCFSWHMDPVSLLSRAEEFTRYCLHENSPDDKRYLKFLGQLATPVLEATTEGSSGLDYGCGPEPVLGMLLEQAGRKVENFDPFFFPDKWQSSEYDFITCSECAEHFYDPDKEFQTLSDLLNENGVMAVMTEKHDKAGSFSDWYYIKDPTHVFFYSSQTFQYIGEKYNLKVREISDRVTLLTTL